MEILHFPETGFLRVKQILLFIPISKSSWWAGVAAGRYPKGTKLSPKITVWRAEAIRQLIDSF